MKSSQRITMFYFPSTGYWLGSANGGRDIGRAWGDSPARALEKMADELNISPADFRCVNRTSYSAVFEEGRSPLERNNLIAAESF